MEERDSPISNRLSDQNTTVSDHSLQQSIKSHQICTVQSFGFFSSIFTMKRPFDLNIPSIEHYPVTKVLTRSDLTTSQLVLPRHPVEEHILPYMNAQSRTRLNADRRENIWVVDDELRTEHLLTLVDREHRFSIISWSHVLRTRYLEEGQTLRFRWMSDKLHFLVDGGEEDDVDDKGDRGDDGKRKRDSSEDVDQPPQKKSKQDEAATLHSSMPQILFLLHLPPQFFNFATPFSAPVLLGSLWIQGVFSPHIGYYDHLVLRLPCQRLESSVDP
ncbi:hypothetical protein AKJ16_DCAP20822 [Drosera capensis]